MKRSLTWALCLLLGLIALPAFAGESLDSQEAPEIQIYVQDKLLQCDSPPYLYQDRTLVPLRAIFEALGADVHYDDSSRTIVAIHKERDRIMVMQVGRPFMAVSSYANSMSRVRSGQMSYRSLGQEMARSAQRIDVAPVIKNDRTMVPVRVISESLGSYVSWDGEDYQVWID